MNNIERVQRQRAAMIQYITKIELKVSRLYGNTCAMIADLQEVKDIINQGSDFTWAQNPEASRKLEKILETYANNVSNIISVACSTAQGQGIADACGNAAYLYANTTGRDKAMVDAVTASALKQQRTNAANAHYYDKRSKGGLQISKNVWKYNDMIKQDMEVAIQNTILEGKSAADLSREVRPMLQNPNALFRRVRNPKTGELELSKAAAAYHPGRGVYRSAYMNAMRLTRTEINAAYRQAETEAYATNPLVSGYRIQPSANHTTLYKGKRIPLYDICDELQGVYPSTFRWSGWHPQCRCIIVPMAIDQDEFETLLYQRGEAIREGKNPNSVDTSFINQVKYPQTFESWVEDNIKRLKEAKNPSAWIEQAIVLANSVADYPDDIGSLLKMIADNHREKEIDYRVLKKITELPDFKELKDAANKDMKGKIFSNMSLAEIKNTGEGVANVLVAQKLAGKKRSVYLMPNPKGFKSPDFIIKEGNKYYSLELKTINGMSSVDNRLEDAAKQSNRIVLDIAAGKRNSRILASSILTFLKKQNSVKEIIIFKGHKEYKVTPKDIAETKFINKFMLTWN